MTIKSSMHLQSEKMAPGDDVVMDANAITAIKIKNINPLTNRNRPSSMMLKNHFTFGPARFAVTLLLPVVLLALTSCSATSPAPAPAGQTGTPASYPDQPDFGGEVVTDATVTTATVVSVDREKRLVMLKRADGSQVTYKALRGALGFDDIQPGDLVKVSLAEELAVFLGKNDVPANVGAHSAKLRVRLPGGTQAVAVRVTTLAFTAKITAINDWNDSVTLALTNGLTKTIKVSEYVNLADVSVGDNVSVRSTESTVVLLEKP